MNQISRILIVVGFTFAILWATVGLLQGSFTGQFKILLIALPLIFSLLLSARRYWVSLVFGCIFLPWAVPVSLLARLTYVQVLCGFFLLIFLVETAMTHSKIAPDWLSKYMWVLVMIVTLRLVVNPPGSARLSGVGGLGEAVSFLLGSWFYFTLRWMAAKLELGRKDTILVLFFAVFGLIFAVVSGLSGPSYMGHFYGWQMWAIAAMTLSLLANSTRIRRVPWFSLMAIVFLAFSALTPHRSRPIFALANVMVIAYLYGRFRKTLVLVSVTVIIGFSALMVTGRGHLPAVVARSLSTIQQLVTGRTEKTIYGNEGFQDVFRGPLWTLAMTRIKEHPIVGSGFGVSREKLIESISRRDTNRNETEDLAMTAGWHNAYLELATSCGVPAAILFALVYFSVIVRFFKWCSNLPHSELKVFSAGLAGYFIQASGQMFMNGNGANYGIICILLGCMSGILIKYAKKELVDIRHQLQRNHRNIRSIPC